MPDDPDADLLLAEATAPQGEEPAPEPLEAAPDPFDLTLGALDAPEPAAALAGLTDEALAIFVAEVVGRARAAPDGAWLARLRALRGVTLARNARQAHALVLAGLADVTTALGDHAAAVEALDHLVGMRALLDQPERAHAAVLQLGAAQARAGQPELALSTLIASMDRARNLERQRSRPVATTCLVRSLLAAGRLLIDLGRQAEAIEWLEGAVVVAEQPEQQAEAEAALLEAQAGG